MTETATTSDAEVKDAPVPNVHLTIVGQDGESIGNFDVVAPPGAAFIINGFHGSQVYELSPNDTNLQVKFQGIESIEPVSPTKEEPSAGMYTEGAPAEDAAAEKPAATTTKATSTKSTS